MQKNNVILHRKYVKLFAQASFAIFTLRKLYAGKNKKRSEKTFKKNNNESNIERCDG
jgi:hypothetical protein